MENSQTQDNASSRGQRWSFVLQYLIPVLLFVATVFALLLSGNFMAGKFFLNEQQSLGDFIWTGLPFGGALLLILGAHAFGHYVSACKHHVHAWLPYFIPNIGLYGTSGAYTKLSWPITERQALIQIFTIGPLAGFCISWVCFVIGMSLSQVIEQPPTPELSLTLGNSLITFLTQWAIHGKLADTHDIVLHPLGFAGWIGLHYNMWHLLPIGKLDGGRLLYAFWGYRVTKWVSGISIGCLVLLSYFWRGWLALAILGLLSLIRFRKQYSVDTYTEALTPSAYYLGWIAIIILCLSFIPIPLSLQGM